jgi:hypothetical protein
LVELIETEILHVLDGLGVGNEHLLGGVGLIGLLNLLSDILKQEAINRLKHALCQ